MANIYETMNVRQKLAKARLCFLNQKVTKSGKNMHLEFKYFELEDIVPPAIRIFARVGLTTNIEFTDTTATMNVFNTDNPEEAPIAFSVPYREVKPIISNQGKEVTNPMQALGSSITYLRRYLWMTVLDITEPDEIDAALGTDDTTEDDNEFAEEAAAATPAKKEKKSKKAPATVAEREEAKKELTSADGTASEEQVAELKTLCKELMDKDEDQEEFVQQIAMKTDGFTSITASACTSLCDNLKEIISQYGEE